MTPDEIRQAIREKIARGELPHPSQFPPFPFGWKYITYVTQWGEDMLMVKVGLS